MAVLFITHKFPPSIGGMQKQSYALINGMRKRTKVFTLIQQPGESKLSFLMSIKGRVKRMLKQHPDISVVHCNDGTVASFCTWLTKYDDIKVTATLHGLDITFPNLLFQKWVVPKLQRFDRIFAVSDATRNVCIAKGFNVNNVAVVKNGVDVKFSVVDVTSLFLRKMKEKFGLDFEKDKILLSIGRPVRRKGFSWFAREVLPHLSEGYKYVVAGPNSTSKLVEITSKVLPLTWSRQLLLATGYGTDVKQLKNIDNKNFIYLDEVPYDELVQLVRSSHLLLMPNIKEDGDMEGFGLVALEASLQTTYVLASRLEGITSAITDGCNGMLVQSANKKAWMTAITSLNHGVQLAKKAQDARAYTEQHYCWDRMVDEYAEHFEEIGARAINCKIITNVTI